jgi:hypothetical protein
MRYKLLPKGIKRPRTGTPFSIVANNPKMASHELLAQYKSRKTSPCRSRDLWTGWSAFAFDRRGMSGH